MIVCERVCLFVCRCQRVRVCCVQKCHAHVCMCACVCACVGIHVFVFQSIMWKCTTQNSKHVVSNHINLTRHSSKTIALLSHKSINNKPILPLPSATIALKGMRGNQGGQTGTATERAGRNLGRNMESAILSECVR